MMSKPFYKPFCSPFCSPFNKKQGGAGGSSALAVPASLKQLLFHDNNVAQPAYYTSQELAGSGLPHDAFFKDYSLGLGDLRPKQPGYCYNFDGVNDYVTVAYNAALNSTNFSARFLFSSTGGSGFRSPLFNRDFTATGRGYGFYVNNSNVLQFWIYENTGVQKTLVGPTVEINEWYDVVGIFDGTNAHLYVNGELVDTEVVSYVPQTARAMRLGAGTNEQTPSVFHYGKLSDVRIYNTALTAGQVADLYTGTEPAVAPIAHYPLQEEAGPRTYDISGNGHHGTIMNATTSGVGSIHVADTVVKKSYSNDEGYSSAYTKDDTFISTVSGTGNKLKFEINTTQQTGILFSNSTANYFLLFFDNATSTGISSGVGSPTYTIDGVPFSGTRIQLRDIIADGNNHTVIVENINFSTWSPSELYFGGYPNTSLDIEPGTIIWNVELNDIPMHGPTIVPIVSSTEDAIGTTPQFTGRVPQYGLAKGPAWQGNATDIRVVFPNPLFPSTDNAKISIPYYHESDATYGCIFSQAETLNANILALMINSFNNSYAANRFELVLATPAYSFISPSLTLTTGNWYFIEIERIGNDWYLYLDGKLQGTVNRNFAVTSVAPGILSYRLGLHAPGRVGQVTTVTGGVTTTYSPIQGTRNVAVTKSDGTYSVINNAVVNGTLANLYSTGNGSWKLPAIENGAHWDGTSLIPAAPGAEVAANGNAKNIPANKHPRSVLVDRTGAVITPLDTAMGTDDLTNEQFNDISPEVTINKRGLSIYAADRYGASLENIQ